MRLPRWLSGKKKKKKNPPANAIDMGQSLGQEDPLEEEMATHSSILAWIIPWVEEPGGLQSMGSQRVGHDWVSTHTHTLRSVLWPLKKSILYTPQKKEGGEHLNKGGRIVLLSTLLRPGLWRTVSSYWSRICREKEPRRFFFFFFPSNG